MSTICAHTLLAAAAAEGQKPAPGQGIWQMFPIFLMLFVLYFVFMRPQQKRAKQHEEMMKTLKSGDKVATSSGIIGVVVSVKDRSVSIRSEESKFEVLKSAVTEVLERKSEPVERKGEPAEAKA
jgi:preprotein translocase subunit YajC